MDPFERLPPELIRLILLHIADFASVQTILSASPWVNSVFHARPRTLILDLVASNPITAVPEIQKLFQGIALIHSPSVHCASLDDYLDMTRENTPSDILSQHLSETEQSQMVQIAARIQHLACICLSTMQRNFVSALEASATGPLSAAVSPQKASRPFSWIESTACTGLCGICNTIRTSGKLWRDRLVPGKKQAAGVGGAGLPIQSKDSMLILSGMESEFLQWKLSGL